MSIVRACLRLATVAALRDRTWAETRVYNSSNAPLAEALKVATAPYIVVYTDDDSREDVDGTDLLRSNRRIALTIAFAVAGPVRAVEGGSVLDMPATDAGFEMTLDLMETEIIAALFHDPQSTWGELIKRFVNDIGPEARSRRGALAEGGVRFAARELTLQVSTIADRPPGVPYEDDHPVKAFIAMARAAPPELDMARAADMIEAAIATTPLPSWRQAQAWLGLTEEAARDLGIGPADGGESDITTQGVGFDPARPVVDGAGAAAMIGDHEPDEDAGTKGVAMPDLTLPNRV